jgi:hypothetical protein
MPSVSTPDALQRAAAGFRRNVSHPPGQPRQIRLRLLRGSLILDLPEATKAVVPQRPLPIPARHRPDHGR